MQCPITFQLRLVGGQLLLDIYQDGQLVGTEQVTLPTGGTGSTSSFNITGPDAGGNYTVTHDPGDGSGPTVSTITVPTATGGSTCPDLQALPDAPTTDKITTAVGFSPTGACVKYEVTPVIYADAQNLPWDDTNPGWVDPATCPEFSELRLYNHISNGGSSTWRNQLENISGVLQWHEQS